MLRVLTCDFTTKCEKWKSNQSNAVVMLEELILNSFDYFCCTVNGVTTNKGKVVFYFIIWKFEYSCNNLCHKNPATNH